ncbi:MAG: SAVED domain-containing protein [Acidobacteria bacterium]|nr:SAVED domain-containing protein [Acidobacteriota bacterium]
MSSYEDLEIEISRCLCKKWEVRVLSSPIDRPRERFEPPFKKKGFLRRIEDFESLLLGHGGSVAGTQREALARELGEALFKSVTPGAMGSTVHRCLHDLGLQRGLRIRLSLGNLEGYRPEIAGLPWELLREPDSEAPLSQGTRNQVVRYLDTPDPVVPMEITRPLRVLAVLSSPQHEDWPPLDEVIRDHYRDLRAKLRGQLDVDLHRLARPTLNELTKRIEAHEFHALHFFGHGDVDKETGVGTLIFEDEDRGPRPVSGVELAKVLESAKKRSLRLAVVNSCQGAMMPRQEGQYRWAGVASALVAAGLPATVAMQFTISAEAAHSFSLGFYTALAEGKPVDLAVAEGRRQMGNDAADPTDYEWATPVLTMRSRDGRIFRVGDPESPREVRLGVLTVAGHGKEEISEEPDDFADLSFHFAKEIKHLPDRGPEAWNREIGPDLEVFLRPYSNTTHPIVLNLAVQCSLGFAAGYFLPAKAGMPVGVRQRGTGGTRDWWPNEEIPKDAQQWPERPVEILDLESPDLALALGISWPVANALRDFLGLGEKERANTAPRVGRLLVAELEVTGQEALRGGGHASQLASQVATRLQEQRAHGITGTIHVFASAPNALLVFLGRLSGVLGRIQLYEFVEQENTYVPSLVLPLETGSEATE